MAFANKFGLKNNTKDKIDIKDKYISNSREIML